MPETKKQLRVQLSDADLTRQQEMILLSMCEVDHGGNRKESPAHHDGAAGAKSQLLNPANHLPLSLIARSRHPR